MIAHVGSTTDNPYQYVGALGYYTHYQDPDFKLLQLGYRFYDPETGRFTQQDPAGDGINWYAYCGGNPMGGVDPWGLSWYDGWLDGTWGSKIPILGPWAEQAGTDVANYQSGQGSLGQAVWSSTKAVGGTVAAGFLIFYAGKAVAVHVAGSRLRVPAPPSVPGPPSGPGVVQPRRTSNPFMGDSNESPITYTDDGRLKQIRDFRQDGYPDVDYDFDHDHGQGMPHKHVWGRPDDGSDPTKLDRGSGECP